MLTPVLSDTLLTLFINRCSVFVMQDEKIKDRAVQLVATPSKNNSFIVYLSHGKVEIDLRPYKTLEDRLQVVSYLGKSLAGENATIDFIESVQNKTAMLSTADGKAVIRKPKGKKYIEIGLFNDGLATAFSTAYNNFTERAVIVLG